MHQSNLILCIKLPPKKKKKKEKKKGLDFWRYALTYSVRLINVFENRILYFTLFFI